MSEATDLPAVLRHSCFPPGRQFLRFCSPEANFFSAAFSAAGLSIVVKNLLFAGEQLNGGFVFIKAGALALTKTNDRGIMIIIAAAASATAAAAARSASLLPP